MKPICAAITNPSNRVASPFGPRSLAFEASYKPTTANATAIAATIPLIPFAAKIVTMLTAAKTGHRDLNQWTTSPRSR